ncbi:ParA family protein [Azotobacter vinelandii]|uniref:ParA family protein n=1 Tax=Azotobacter vinelandii TaxID=354 RepID=UPI002666BB15|nr:ParA family protein [Azotobacter vinelandii]WKN23784.1 ParA family protein [Azotobacter vinelandii]
MFTITVISTKGGVGKSTTCAHLGALLADAGLRVLMLDLDSQPTLSSYYRLTSEARGGVYELIALNQTDPDQVVSRTVIDGLDIVVSNDFQGQLPQLLLAAPDGRFRLSNLIRRFHGYDVVLIDTQGARSITLESAVLASDHALSPITPELLAAREFIRGTLGMLDELQTLTQYTHLRVPRVSLLINRLDETRHAQDVADTLRKMFPETADTRVGVMNAHLRHLTAFRQAAALGQPIHRFEPVKPAGRKSPAGADQCHCLRARVLPGVVPTYRETTHQNAPPPPSATRRSLSRRPNSQNIAGVR